MIIGFVGRRGGGKTLSAVRQLSKDREKGRHIFSNISLKFPYDSINKDMLLEFMNSSDELKNTSVLLDEIHMYMDSRLSASKRNLLISYFLLQSRKRDVDIYYTTQSVDQIDRRLRQQTDILVFSDTVSKSMNGVEIVFVKNVVVDVHTNDMKSVYYVGNKYFKYYNTYEIVGFE